MRGQWAEIIMGVIVLGLAAAFLAYVLTVGGFGQKPGGYPLIARFSQAGSLAPGATVTVAGVKVGTVSKITLEPKTYLARVALVIDSGVKLPSDSSAKITSDSLLGGVHVSVEPGGAADDLKPGGEIDNTQGAVDLFGLIGQIVRPQSGAAPTDPAAPDPAAAAAQ